MLRGVKDLNSYEQGSNSANGADVFASPDGKYSVKCDTVNEEISGENV